MPRPINNAENSPPTDLPYQVTQCHGKKHQPQQKKFPVWSLLNHQSQLPYPFAKIKHLFLVRPVNVGKQKAPKSLARPGASFLIELNSYRDFRHSSRSTARRRTRPFETLPLTYFQRFISLQAPALSPAFSVFSSVERSNAPLPTL